MKNIIFTILTLVSTSSFALLTLPTAANYETGHFLCEQKYAFILNYEKGVYVTVPVDYAHPEKGATEVYAYFSGGFDATKDTLLYFTGGPGQTVHWGLFKQPVGFNVLIMEHRGIGCSRPATVDLLLNPDFYSSENVARDAEAVRKSLNIPKITVYGISYGTAPATIYASLFPNTTRAVILEGTIFSGDSGLWAAPHRRKLLQKMIDGLPVDIKAKMELIHSQDGITDIWLSAMARDTLLYNDGLNTLKKQLLGLSDDQNYKKLVQDLKARFAPITYEPNILFTDNDIVYYMISCQELGLAQPNVTSYDSLINSKLVPKIDQDSIDTCKQLNAKANKTYYASHYPFKAPITYFQGSDDGATVSPEAIQHYKTVPQGAKQLLILVRGGHNPNLLNINGEEVGQLDMFNLAFKGQAIPKDLLDKVHKGQSLFWAYTSKNF